MNALLVMIGGAVGAVARYYLERWSVHRFGERMPYGTAVANLVGAAVIGLTGAAVFPLVGSGFCGGLTTFGGFMGQIENRLRHKANRRLALGYAGVVTVAGVALVMTTKAIAAR